MAETLTPKASAALAQLVASKALSASQAERLASLWDTLDDDDWAQPSLRGIAEHTRAHIARLRQECRS
jgi:hypothetical protein